MDFFYNTKNIGSGLNVNEIYNEFKGRNNVVLVWNTSTKETKVFAIGDLAKTLKKFRDNGKFRFFDTHSNELHPEFDIKHLVRQAKRHEQIRLYQTIICGGEVIR